MENAEPVEAPDRRQVAVPERPSRTPRDMAISLLVLLVPVVLLVGTYQALSDRDQPLEVDPAPALSAARDAGLEAAATSGLDADWVPVSAVFRRVDAGATLRMGYVSPAGDGVQLVQSDVPAEQLLSEELTGAGAPAGTIEVAGRTWHRYPARAGERALVLLEPERTVLVIGTAAQPELQELAASLR